MRGLYGKVNISVKTLDKIIVVGIIAMVLVMILGLQHRGYTVSFNSMGGTDVASQDHMYGESLEIPEPPTREGFVFSGWYRDKNYQYPWDFEENKVTESTELFAAWQSK